MSTFMDSVSETLASFSEVLIGRCMDVSSALDQQGHTCSVWCDHRDLTVLSDDQKEEIANWNSMLREVSKCSGKNDFRRADLVMQRLQTAVDSADCPPDGAIVGPALRKAVRDIRKKMSFTLTDLEAARGRFNAERDAASSAGGAGHSSAYESAVSVPQGTSFDVDGALKKLRDLCDNEKHLQAGERYVQFIQEEMKFKGPPQLSARVAADIDLQHMLWKVTKIKEVLGAVNASTEDGWSAPKVKKSLSISSKLSADNVVSFKVEGVIKQKLFNICSLLYEADLHTQWVPMVTEAKQLGMPNQCGQYAQMIFRHAICTPVPGISNREFTAYAFASNLMHTEHKCVVIYGHSVADELNEWMGCPIVRNPKHVQVDLRSLSYIMEPCGPNAAHTKISMIVCADPKITFAPSWIIDKVSGIIVKKMYTNMNKLCRKFETSIYADRVRANRTFYGWLEGQMEEAGLSSKLENQAIEDTSEDED